MISRQKKEASSLAGLPEVIVSGHLRLSWWELIEGGLPVVCWVEEVYLS